MAGKLNKINKFFSTSDYFGNNNTTPLIRELTEILIKKKWKPQEINDFMRKAPILNQKPIIMVIIMLPRKWQNINK